ncbi:hypothetical protein [Moorena producens]
MSRLLNFNNKYSESPESRVSLKEWKSSFREKPEAKNQMGIDKMISNGL